jgi:asparagine synthase (glutamine-hydrolysing)
MCGIAGIQVQQGLTPDHNILELFRTALYHRGPDDSGIETYDNTGFVHTRLSIIDLAQGHQPLKDRTGTAVIVNGEIYNYIELRHQLAGYAFQTHSDCEAILPLYHRYGLEFTAHLRGMYGLALYDPLKKQLILARDPFGIKPLYYVTFQHGLAFASEMQALLKAKVREISVNAVNPSARAELLQLRYNTAADTVIRDIYRVLPGELLVIQNGQIIERRRQTALPIDDRYGSLTAEQALQELGAALKDSVGVHLRADVPYGLFLSGGLDSATVLKLMTECTSQPIKTYTIGFSGSRVHDERAQARLLAHFFRTEHTELDYREADFWKDLPLVVAAMDDPIFDQAMLPTYKLAQEARKSVKVILCGEGGDELLCGYRRYQKARWPWWLGGRLMREKGTFTKAGLSCEQLNEWQQSLNHLKTIESRPGYSKLQIAQAIDCSSWLPNNLLIKLDRCLMAHGVEGRTPFLDPVVARLCFNLPDTLKVHWTQGKWLLRQWLQQNVPISHPFAKKKGFRVPVEEWIFNKGPRLGYLVASQAGIEEIIEPGVVKDIFIHPRPQTSYIAWILLTYAVWHQIYVVGKPVVPDTLSILS